VASWLTTALLLMRLVGDPSPVSLGLSYIHRRLQIGYNRAASLMVRMDRRHFRSDESGQVGEEEGGGY
jgi:DNA segregation ATPase FtsK/SpoIIIE-like protein